MERPPAGEAEASEPSDASVCEECDDVAEAEGMAADYGRIIGKLVVQRELIDE